MLSRLKEMFALPQDRAPGHDELHLAVAALLAEAAALDGETEPRERAAIQRVLQRHFKLSPDEAAELTSAGEAAADESAQIFRFTRIINDRLKPEQRVELFEMMYEVIYSDDDLHDYEANLMRRLGELVYVSDRDRGAARLRVLDRLGLRA